MSCKDKCGYPINPAPFAPGDCGPGHCGPRPPMPPRPPMKPGCPPSQYIGSRYVPIFADPIEWDINRAYESLTIVTFNGESYTSKCNVGPGIDIANTRYWAKTGAYNAQLEQCKESVKDLSSQVTGFAEDNKEFREKITQFEKDNAEMKNTVAEDKARVDALAERVTTAETEIDGLQATTNQHTKELADLHAKDEDLQRQITSNDNDIAAIQAKNVEQDGRLDGIDTKLKSHDASIAQNTSDIAKNTKNIQDNAANIAINAHEIADHAEKLKDHEARLTAQHEEITANHQAIERNTSDIAGLRSDLTEDEAKIEANRDAIAHIQEKDVQQDGRLDKLEECCEEAKEHFTQLDTKTDATNTALNEEIDRAKAAEVANGKLIAANAAELADHAEELADHEERITALETDNTKNKTDIADIKAKNVEQDTAIETVRDSAAHAQETATAAEGKADANATTIGSWDANHPGKTISEAVTDNATAIAGNSTLIENLQHGLSSTNEKVTGLENSKADKSEIPDVSGFVTTETYTAGQTAQDKRLNALEESSSATPPKFMAITPQMFHTSSGWTPVAVIPWPWSQTPVSAKLVNNSDGTDVITGITYWFIHDINSKYKSTFTIDTATVPVTAVGGVPVRVSRTFVRSNKTGETTTAASLSIVISDYPLPSETVYAGALITDIGIRANPSDSFPSGTTEIGSYRFIEFSYE